MIVDTRNADAFAAGHIPGTINIPINKSFTTWAGWLVPFHTEFYLIADDGIDESVRDLAMIGLDQVAGYFNTDVVSKWAASSGQELETIQQIDASELASRMRNGEVTVIDVRGHAEWEGGHIPGVDNIPVGYINDRLAEVPASKPVVVQCQSGSRSAIAASVLQASGIKNVINLTGGISEWIAQDLPLEREEKTPEMVA